MENPQATVQVATAGEALIDMVGSTDGTFRACPGGSVFNLTRALALQEVGTAYLNPLSADRFGRLLGEQLVQAGAVLAQAAPVAAPTSMAVVHLDPQGQPGYTFFREGVADRAVEADGLVAATARWPDLRAVCTGCFALAPQDQGRYLPWLRACRERGIAVVVDANVRPSVIEGAAGWRESIGLALSLADLIKVSDEDLQSLAPEAGQPAEALARRLFATGAARWIALTRGAQGALLLARDGRTWQARDNGAFMRVEDTVGAGDCFLAGLLAGLLGPDGLRADDPSAEGALRRAIASASHCVQRVGCQPPRAADLDGRALARVIVQRIA